MYRLILVCILVTCSFAQQFNPGCLLQPVEGNPRMFQVNAPFRGNRQFPCPTNTLFDPKHCGCGWVDKPINPSPESLRPGSGFGIDRPGGMMGNGGMGPGMGPGMGMGGAGIDPGSVVDPSILTEPFTTTRPPCTLKAHPDRHMYEEFILGRDWLIRRCPMGTLFNQASCACHDIDPNQKYTCNPELWINFNGREIEDSAGYQISVGNNGNVVNVSNAGRFDGTGTLTVWQYANQDLGTGLTVNLKFYEFPGGASDEQVLIANCYARQLGSIEIALDTKNKMVIFRVEARIGRYPEGVELLIPYREKAWKNVTLAYDGNEVMAKVDQEIKTAPLKGHVTTRYNGFLIGSCNGRGYVGYIDDLRLYRCLLDQSLNNGFPGTGSMNMMNNMNNMNMNNNMNTMNMNNNMNNNMNTMNNNMNNMNMNNNMNTMNNVNNMDTMDVNTGAGMDPSMGAGQPMI